MWYEVEKLLSLSSVKWLNWIKSNKKRRNDCSYLYILKSITVTVILAKKYSLLIFLHTITFLSYNKKRTEPYPYLAQFIL